MNLDDLMEVWRSQDAAPLHGVNQTLLHLALRKEQAKLQAVRRRERWIIYLTIAGLVAAMMVFLAVMISTRERHDLTGWDFAVGIVAAAAALLVVRAIYMNHRAESRLEQSFGRSLRDQLNRSIAQLEHEAARARRTSVLVLVLMGGICPAAILLLGWRVNGKSISDDGYLLVTLLIVCVWTVAIGVWQLRRSVQNDILPRKRRLEALLKKFDSQ
jgi:hypothetical protein